MKILIIDVQFAAKCHRELKNNLLIQAVRKQAIYDCLQ